MAIGQPADFAVLSSDFFSVPDGDFKRLQSVLTVGDGEVVYAADGFAPPGFGVDLSFKKRKASDGYLLVVVRPKERSLTRSKGIPSRCRLYPFKPICPGDIHTIGLLKFDPHWGCSRRCEGSQ